MGFTFVILTFCTVSVYSVYKIHRIHGHLRLIKAGYLQLVLTLTELNGELRSYDVILDEEDPDLLARSMRMAKVLHPFPSIIRRHLGEARRIAADWAGSGGLEQSEQQTLEEMRARLDGLVARMDGFEATFGELFMALAQRDYERAFEVQKTARTQERELRREVSRMTISLRHLIDASILRAEKAETTSFWVVVALTVVAMLLSVVVTFLAGRTLEPIRRLTDAVKELREGREPTAVDITGQDEVALLAGEFNRMVSALRQRDQALRRSERLATIGRMSAQVAHEVRNPLQSIGLNIELLEEDLASMKHEEPMASDPDMTSRLDEALELLRSIQAEAERLNGVTEEYLRLARLPNPDREELPINGVVEGLVSFVSEEVSRAGVTVTLELDPSDPTAPVDENQLRQALLNLVRNALEAMEPGGRLGIRTRVMPDGSVEVAVEDDGAGIPAEDQEHVFEPFFSTKEGGTGLGLALTQSIVEAHRGSIRCDSRVGEGTTFTITLPGPERGGV